MSKTIAIVEDQLSLAQNYKSVLEDEGYQVVTYASLKSAKTAFDRHLPDMAIIDIMLGDEQKGGHELCLALRHKSTTLPIIFLTALNSEMDEILGLTLGANDYLSKDITLRQLTTRVATLFKTCDAMLDSASNQNFVTVGDLELNVDCMIGCWRGEDLRLNATEFEIVHCLAVNPGHVKSRGQIAEFLDERIKEDGINSHIKRIRKKLRSLDEAADPIRSEHGRGYRWVP